MLGATALDRWVRVVEQYQESDRRLGELDARRTALNNQLRRGVEDLAAALRDWVADPAPADTEADDSIDRLAEALVELRRRCSLAEDAVLARRQARDRQQRDRGELERLREDRAELLQQAGLAADRSSELRPRIDRLPEWRELQRQRQALQAEVDRLDRAIADSPEGVEAIERGDRTGLAQQRAEIATLAERHADLIDQRARLRQQLDSAGADGALEQALAAETEARDRLASIRDQALGATCAGVLADALETDFRQQHEPALLRTARRRFAEFTHHAWDLAVEREHGVLAIETSSGRKHSPAELSTATRMQLLLALRCSWAEHLERGRTGLPFVLDEALTTSDPERFAAAASSLQQLADKHDRQILYLSASTHEARLWQQATGREPTRIDLGELRGMQARADLGPAPEAQRPVLPEPEGSDPARYARRIGVSRLDPRLDATAQHPFWVLDDRLELLHRLLVDWRIERIGALQQLLAGPGAEIALPEAPERQRLAARIEVLRTWIEAWRIGRGRPVDRVALEQADGVTEKMLTAVSDAADACDGDARALLEALDQRAVSGFRKDKLEQLSNWLQDRGYLDPRPILDAEQRRSFLLERCARLLDIASLQSAIDLLEHGAE